MGFQDKRNVNRVVKIRRGVRMIGTTATTSRPAIIWQAATWQELSFRRPPGYASWPTETHRKSLDPVVVSADVRGPVFNDVIERCTPERNCAAGNRPKGIFV